MMQLLTLGALAGAAVTASLVAAPGMAGWLGAALAVVMLAIAFIDAREFIIPDRLIIGAVVLGLVNAVAAEPQAIATAVAVAGARALVLALALWLLRLGYGRWRGREGIGLGDVKLAAVNGLWLDWLPMTLALDIAALAALAAAAVQALRGRRVTARTALPFGLFFAPAIWLGWLIQAMLPRLIE